MIHFAFLLRSTAFCNDEITRAYGVAAKVYSFHPGNSHSSEEKERAPGRRLKSTMSEAAQAHEVGLLVNPVHVGGGGLAEVIGIHTLKACVEQV